MVSADIVPPVVLLYNFGRCIRVLTLSHTDSELVLDRSVGSSVITWYILISKTLICFSLNVIFLDLNQPFNIAS